MNCHHRVGHELVEYLHFSIFGLASLLAEKGGNFDIFTIFLFPLRPPRRPSHENNDRHQQVRARGGAYRRIPLPLRKALDLFSIGID